MTATVQMNARIDRALKDSGDAALALIGLNPTQAVRSLWEKAARRGADLEQVAELLNPASAQASDGDKAAAAALTQGRAFMAEAYQSLGIGSVAPVSLPSDDELLEEARYERLAERGLA